MPSPVPFHKMEGTANDFVVVLRRDLPPGAGPADAVTLCDRRRGVGADGVLVVGLPGDADWSGDAVASMTVWNSDGSTAEMCGNGLRCVALRLVEDGYWPGDAESARIATATGEVLAQRAPRGFRVSLGAPAPQAARSIETVAGSLPGTPVSMGNPHFIVFADDPALPALPDLVGWGPEVAVHPAFPEGTNVEWIVVDGPDRLTMRVWERGAGETQACGSGACAAVVAARLSGRVSSDSVDVALPGGVLTIRWGGDPGAPVSLEGPARTVFTGETPWP